MLSTGNLRINSKDRYSPFPENRYDKYTVTLCSTIRPERSERFPYTMLPPFSVPCPASSRTSKVRAMSSSSKLGRKRSYPSFCKHDISALLQPHTKGHGVKVSHDEKSLRKERLKKEGGKKVCNQDGAAIGNDRMSGATSIDAVHQDVDNIFIRSKFDVSSKRACFEKGTNRVFLRKHEVSDLLQTRNSCLGRTDLVGNTALSPSKDSAEQVLVALVTPPPLTDKSTRFVGKRRSKMNRVDRVLPDSIRHTLILNGPGHIGGDQFDVATLPHSEATISYIPEDPCFYTHKILGAIEMQLLWLGEESMYCLGQSEFHFPFIYFYATEELRRAIRQIDLSLSEAEKITHLVDMKGWLVRESFERGRLDIRRMLSQGHRRRMMQATIARFRVALALNLTMTVYPLISNVDSGCITF